MQYQQKNSISRTSKFIIRSSGEVMKPSTEIKRVSQTSLINKEILKEAINEVLNENPELIQNAIKPVIEDLINRGIERFEFHSIEQAKDRTRLSDIELLLGLNGYGKKSIYFDEARYEELFSESIFSNISNTNQTTISVNVHELLYSELQNVPSLRNKEVQKLLGWNKENTTKVSRLMRSMSKIYNDVVCDTVPGHSRALRIYIKKQKNC
jgi:hypothetical protein